LVFQKKQFYMQPAAIRESFPELRDPVDSVIASLRNGLPTERIDALSGTLDLSLNRLGGVLSIPPSTISRRRKEGRLDRDESERAFRLARLVERATEMAGSPGAGVRWLKAPQYALGGQAPLDYADTEVGARVVEDLIGRIEHGIPA
jgi:putative toxin-antitoxin system antitoxin component (TIGR02293 family)